MKPEYPTPLDYPALRALWKEAFADNDAFLDGFWRAGFSPKRCRCIIAGGKAHSALYWFDCTMQGQKYAYLYAVATAEEARGQGLCTALMDDTHTLLKKLGYAGAVLVPGEKSLFAFYEKRGYRVAACVDEFTCEVSEGAPISMQALSAEEFDSLRKTYLPHGGMAQEGADTFWELYDPKDPGASPYGGTIVNSYCHAWSCAPAYFLRKFF